MTRWSLKLHRRKLGVDRTGQPLGGLWTEPLARGLTLDSREAGDAQRNILRSKPSLRVIYQDAYRAMLDAADTFGSAEGGSRIELGSGGGFLGELDPSIITSDVRLIDGLDIVFDACAMPFSDRSVDVIFAMHVLHHIAAPRLFLAELERVLKPGGPLLPLSPSGVL